MRTSLACDKLAAALGSKALGREELSGMSAMVVEAPALAEAAKFLMADPELAMDMLIELGGADYSGYPEPRAHPLCVSYHFHSTSTNQRAWIKVYLPMDKPEVESLTPLFAAANWYERECWDMFGVNFTGHPYLKRLLLYEEFTGHPLRKDYPIMKSQPLIPMRSAVDYEAVAMRRRQEEGKA